VLLKKLAEAEGDNRKPKEKTSAEKEENNITLDDIILAGLERGLTMSDIRRMQLGQVVDFCIAYNERQKEAEKMAKKAEKRAQKRRANQNDINAYFG
jgi:hypothetical protein